ncbi:MAG: transporter associated domain-containing protein, partial [Verrucomicrobiota bacterium]
GDVMREIVGGDEEGPRKQRAIRRLNERMIVAAGKARVEDVEEALDVELSAEGLDTIGGLVFNRLGKQGQAPRVGERVRLGDADAEIREVGDQRIKEVLVERRKETAS